MLKLCALAMLSAVCIPAATPSVPDQQAIRNAAAHGLAALQASQSGWYRVRECSSCHHQVLPALAFRVARDHAVPLNEELAHRDAVGALSMLAQVDRAIQYTHVIDPSMDDGYRLLAADAAGVAPSLTTALYARILLAHQLPDGHWVTGDARPPQSYSLVTATAVSLHAVQLYRHPTQAAAALAAVARARNWLVTQAPRETEERAFQLLGLAWAGVPAPELQGMASKLLAAQQKDGGWNSLDGRASDAYSTGQALVALQDAAGIAPNDARWARGIRFLLDAQQPDGTWHVASRMYPPAPMSPPYFETGYPYGHDQVVSVMGACWAVMALAEALPLAAKPAKPVLTEAAPADVEPWMETALFGSAADLRHALDQHLDPNAATKGGTTALMMAVPDVAKTTLLLDGGANVNQRSKTRYSALLVASQFPDAFPVQQLLLSRGAEVRLPPGAGMPLFNATALGLSAIAGNARAIPLLAAKGDKVDEKFMFLGLFSQAAATACVQFDDVPTLTALLDAGLSPNLADGDGFSLLDLAAVTNRPRIVALLLARGAKIDQLDKNGMTALQFAASIDYGDSAIVELLLKAGADARLQTKEGLTALALARKYKHQHLTASLQ